MCEDDSCPCEDYDELICEHCGRPIKDGRTVAREFHGLCECFFFCNECDALCPMCGEKECTCLEELKNEPIPEIDSDLCDYDWLVEDIPSEWFD